jgi:hypothetical protein
MQSFFRSENTHMLYILLLSSIKNINFIKITFSSEQAASIANFSSFLHFMNHTRQEKSNLRHIKYDIWAFLIGLSSKTTKSAIKILKIM